MSELRHHGIKGQKWYHRRFQNPDGTLTEAGRLRYGAGKAPKNAKEANRRAAEQYKKKLNL